MTTPVAQHKAYSVMQRPILYFGVTPNLLVIELFIGVILFATIKLEVGFGFYAVGGSVGIFILLHSFFCWAMAKDERIQEKLMQYLNEPDILAPGNNRNLPPGFGGMI